MPAVTFFFLDARGNSFPLGKNFGKNIFPEIFFALEFVEVVVVVDLDTPRCAHCFSTNYELKNGMG